MYNFKKLFTYLVVGALVIALSISCKSNEEPSGYTHSNHPPAGTYIYGNLDNQIKATVVNNADGTCRITGTASHWNGGREYEYESFDITITKWWQPNNSTVSFASSESKESEATINSPSGVNNFSVDYNHENGRLEIRFGPLTESYHTVIEKKQ